MMGRKVTAFKVNNKVACKPAQIENSGPCSEDVSNNLPTTCERYKRVDEEEYDRIVASPVLGQETHLSNTMLLRPLGKRKKGKLDEFEQHLKAKLESNPFSEVDGYRLMHLGTVTRVIQEASLAHYTAQPTCSGILVALADCEVKRGAGVEEVFGCPLCHFKSERKALYRELPQQKPGRNPCELNVALQLALHNTCLSTAGAQRFLSCLTSTSPTAANLQKAANKVGPILEEENERDMTAKRQIVKDTLQARGMPRDTPIHAEYDRQYNNPLRNSRKQTPFAPATQSRDVLVENATKDKFIVAFNHTNKLCSVGNYKRRKGEQVECPGHEGCSATVSQAFNIGNEEDGGEKLAHKILQGAHPLKVSHLTTDADGKGFQGFRRVMKMASGRDTENMLDEQHLNRALCRAATSTEFSLEMFPARTTSFKRLLQKRFAEDLSHRVQAEISACRRALRNDRPKVVQAMRDCAGCILKCYSGDHTDCWKKSFVCKKKRIYRFPFMPAIARGSLRILGLDKAKLTKLIETRTCGKQQRATRFGTSTQKAEAMNSAFRTTNPKQGSTYSRNARYRDHSAIHMVNNGPGESIVLKMSALGLKPSLSSISILQRLQHRRDYFQHRHKLATLRARRAILRNKRYRLHERQRNFSENVGSGYCSNQLIGELADHTYSKRGNCYDTNTE